MLKYRQIQYRVEYEEDIEDVDQVLLGPKLPYKPQKAVENITVCIEVSLQQKFPVTNIFLAAHEQHQGTDTARLRDRTRPG